MSEIVVGFSDPLEQELAKIDNPAERSAFLYFYNQTTKEGLKVLPSYTFDQFENGIAPFNGMPMDFIEGFVTDTGLIPNFNKETTEANGLTDCVPLAESLRGPFIKMLAEKRKTSAVRVMAIHPSLATPYVVAGAINLAYMADIGEDIRSSIFPVVGAYPAVMKYVMRDKNGKEVEVSPVDIGRCLGNLVLTAPKTANTETDEIAVQEWMRAKRATFKLRNREILNEIGNVEIVEASGRRVLRSNAKVPPYLHKEFRPDGNLDYITDIPVPTFIIGVDDNLLIDPGHPESIVNMVGYPYPRYLTREKHVIDALKRSAQLSSVGENVYEVEGRVDQVMRLGKSLVRNSIAVEE